MALSNSQKRSACSNNDTTDVQELPDGPELPIQSWLAISQDIWGTGCFAPGRTEAIHAGAGALAINKTQIVGAVGAELGSFESVVTERGTYIELFESHAAILNHVSQESGPAGKFVRPAAWDSANPSLRTNRYHRLFAIHAFSTTPNPLPVAKTILDALKPEGFLFTDELWMANRSATGLVMQGAGPDGGQLHLSSRDEIMDAFAGAGLESRKETNVSASLMASIRNGLSRGEKIAARLKQTPEPLRRQRLEIFTDELERASWLHFALEKGLLTAMHIVHRKPAVVR